VLDIFYGGAANEIPAINSFLLCTVCSLIFGFAVAAIYMFRNKYSKSMAVTLVLLPLAVQVIITVVNGNIGAGIAVMGAFSLVRFRSIPGNARDICSLFIAMAVGLVTGMGYLLYAFIFLLLSGAVSIFLVCIRFGEGRTHTLVIRITINENENYNGMFDDIFAKYAEGFELDKVKIAGMGNQYELIYHVRLKSASMPKELIDELRSRNGNLNVMISRERRDGEEL